MALIAALAAMAGASAAQAASCGVTGSGSVATGVYYNPFDTNALSNVDVALTLTRVVGPNGDKTQEVYFVIILPNGSPAYQVSVQSPGGSTYTNITYPVGSVPSNLPVVSNNTSGQIAYQFGGAAKPDTATFNVRVTVPANTDLSAGQPISLGIRYVCKGTGQLKNVDTATDIAGAIKIDVHVLSGLQAFYSGSQFDFGEIGTLSTSQVLASPVRTDAANHFSVKSSGAFNVTLSSQKGFQLTNGGSAAGDKVDYKVKFLGAVLTKASAGPGATALNKDCAAVHITNFSSLPIQATLLEGGQGKNPSGSYTDTLTVTLTPNAANFAGGDACTSYSVP
ncbi:MAG TPA: hypothetical protein VFP14_06525, partial [Novosphingobium sp.]|nr:hypothetical protein [Novosphingobium sp.]